MEKPLMLLVSVLFAAGAAWQITETWFEGSIFARRFGCLEHRRNLAQSEDRFDFWAELMTCRYCLSIQISLPVSALTMLAWASAWDWFWLPIHWLVTARLVTFAVARIGYPFRDPPTSAGNPTGSPAPGAVVPVGDQVPVNGAVSQVGQKSVLAPAEESESGSAPPARSK